MTPVFHRWRTRAVVLACLWPLAAPTFSQTGPAAPLVPQNVLNLAASASQEVTKDWLSITLSTTREAADGASVQSQLRTALEAALAQARQAARPGQLEVRTGGFSIGPRYAGKGSIANWQGSAELVVEGRDVAAVSALAGRLQTLSVARVSFVLSREAREKAEADVAAQAIARFRAQAQAVSAQFGFGGYTVREVTLGGGAAEPPISPLPRMTTLAMAADAAVPVEAGKATVTVTVNGSVQMTR